MLVTAAFPSEAAAQAALDTLESNGIDRAQVGILTAASEDGLSLLDPGAFPASDVPYDPDSAGFAKGAWIGGLGYLGATTAAGLIILTGGGLGVALAGMLAAGGGGGLVGALVAAGFHQRHADFVEDRLDRGGLTLWVNAVDAEQAAVVRAQFGLCGGSLAPELNSSSPTSHQTGKETSVNIATASPLAPTISGNELLEIGRANASGRQPVIFVHGLWLLPSSWDRWADLFDAAGYAALTPGWPDDPDTAAEANAHPAVMAGKSIGQVADHFAAVAGALDRKPAIIGHSFGGLLAQILAGRGLSAATVAIDPAPFRGVLPLPFSALKSAFPILGNPANRNRAVPLTYDQFRYAFANAVDDDEAKSLYETYAVPAPGEPLFQSAAANFNPWSEAKVDTANPDRGPMLVMSGEKDHTVPHSVADAAFKLQKHNSGLTEFIEMKDRGHALTIDHGWHEVAEVALSFVKRFAS